MAVPWPVRITPSDWNRNLSELSGPKISGSELLGTTALVTDLGRRAGFLRRATTLRAVDGVDLSIAEGEAYGVVGESGCGKTTLARTLLGLQREAAGEIRLAGRSVGGLAPAEARRVRSAIQYVHQDPGAALDPWWRVGATLAEGLVIHGVSSPAERAARIAETLEAVGLDATMTQRYPHELSGGQQRRIGLARILLLRPRLVILDEPTAGLDLSVQASVLRLLRDLRERFGLTYLFISHDLTVVRRVCDRVGVMYLGRIVEEAPAEELFTAPRHPYTRALLAAAPHLDGRAAGPALPGEPPSLRRVPGGCRFHPRCAIATAQCALREPPTETAGPAHSVACHHWRDAA